MTTRCHGNVKKLSQQWVYGENLWKWFFSVEGNQIEIQYQPQHSSTLSAWNGEKNIQNIWSRILSPIHNLIWLQAIQPIRFSKDHRCFSCRLQWREACVSHKDHRLATYRKGLCITILSSKDWAGAQGSCATASPPHRHTVRGDLDLQAGTRDLSAGTQAWTLLQLARREQAGFLHTRHDISELIPHHHHHPPPHLSLLPCKPPLCRLPAHLLPGLSLTEGMGSELNLDTEFPHFTDGWERLCMEVRKQIERKERERERGSLNGGAEAGPISHRGRVR